MQTFVKSLNEHVLELSEGQIETAVAEDGLRFNMALAHDAIVLYGTAVMALGLEEGAKVSCDQQETWGLGSTIINYARAVRISTQTH